MQFRCADRSYTVNLSGNYMQVKALQCCWKKNKLVTKKRVGQTLTELILLLFHANLEAKNELRISFRNLCWIFVNFLERGRCLVHEWFLHCLDNFKFLSQNWTNIIWFIAGLNHRFHMLLTMQWFFDIQRWYLRVLAVMPTITGSLQKRDRCNEVCVVWLRARHWKTFILVDQSTSNLLKAMFGVVTDACFTFTRCISTFINLFPFNLDRLTAAPLSHKNSQKRLLSEGICWCACCF